MVCAIVNTNQIICLSLCVFVVQWPWPLVNRVLWWSSWWFRWLLSSCYLHLELDCSSGEGISAISRCFTNTSLSNALCNPLYRTNLQGYQSLFAENYKLRAQIWPVKHHWFRTVSWSFVFGWTIALTEIEYGCAFSFCSLTATWQLHQQKPFSTSMVCEIIH